MRSDSPGAVTGRLRPLLLTLLTLALASAAVVAGAAVTASQASASLGPATNFPVQDQPSSIAVADFNGDHVADLAVANSGSLSVSILLGTVSGAFGTATNFSIQSGAGRIPTSVAVRDLNGDTFPDLVVGVGGIGLASSVQVMLGTGTGAFGTPATFPAANDPWSVVTGNFNGDSYPDIASASRTNDTVSVLAGDGTGNFAAPLNFPVGVYPTSIAAGDLNGDSLADLVTANANTDNISVLLADGSGSFSAATSVAVGHYPSSLVIGKLDSNSSLDIAVADSMDGTVTALLNNGSGVFNPLPPFPTGSGAASVAIGDLNNDSFADLAVGNYFGATVSMLTGNGTGAFGSKVDYPSTDPSFVTIGIFGTDPLPDLAYANEGTDDVSVRLSSDAAPPLSLSPNPATLDFGSQELGTQSASKTVMIVNNGAAGVPIDLAGVAGTMRDDFPFISSQCDGVLLPPGAACGVTIAFKPSVAGPRSAQIVIAPGGGKAPIEVPIIGTGGNAPIGIATAETGGNAPIGIATAETGGNAPIGIATAGTGATASISTVTVSGPTKVVKGRVATLRVRMTNAGGIPATGVRLTARGKGIRFSTQVGTIASGQTTMVKVRFKPSRAGRIKVSYRVTSANAGAKTVTRMITVR